MNKYSDTIAYKKRRLFIQYHRITESSEKTRRNQKKKMARVCFVFLLIAAAVLLADSKSTQKCPKNEQWNDCGTACEPSCKVPNPEICTLQCVIGCQCKPGLLRNDDGHCVKKSEC